MMDLDDQLQKQHPQLLDLPAELNLLEIRT